ncbi:hypothetical protein K7432_013764 [Basidiobolus ranarum]|uniref:Uncharacterized protein n=1 Tax=Basidiobolus ranarum TaxID=34480 RepID=A0ABR2VQD0_9FUNG
MDYQRRRMPLSTWLGLSDLDLSIPVTSNFVPSYVLIFTRTISLIYTLTVAITNFVINIDNVWEGFFVYFTDLSFLGLVAYFMVSTYHSLRYYNGSIQFLHSSWIARSKFLRFVYWLLYETIVVFHVVVPIVYWTLIFTPSNRSTLLLWVNGSIHGSDFFFMIIEVVLGRWTLTWKHLPFVLLFPVLYMCMAFLNYAINDYFVYGFLNWYARKSGYVALIYLGVALFFVAVFVAMLYVHRLRDRIGVKRRPELAEREGLSSNPLQMIQVNSA